MARGQFLQGLSEGIFERQNQLNQQQEAKDFQSKQDVVRMLTGLADKVEPDSLPLLMGHIWDTMGIKKQASGKGLRGFLDAFSGQPNRSVEDQLGTQLKSLTDSFVGPEQARQVRMRNAMAQKGIPGFMQAAPNSPYAQQAAGDLQNLSKKMVFRDPYQQKLEEIQARYGAALENQRQRQEESHTAAMDRLVAGHNLKIEENDKKYSQSINKAVDQMAIRMLQDPDIQALAPKDRPAAAKRKAQSFLSDEAQTTLENKKKDLKVKDSIIGKNSAEAQANKPITPYQKAQLDEKVVTDVQEILGRFGPSAKSALDLEKTYGALRKQMEDIAAKRGLQYSADAGVFLGDPVKVKVAEAFAGDTMRLTREARDKFREAEGKASAEHLKLKDKRFEGYLNIGNSWRDPVTVTTERSRGKAQPPPKAQKKGVGHVASGVAPALGSSGTDNMTNPPGGQTFDATTVPTNAMPGNWVRARKDQIEGRGHKSGDVINIGPKKYQVGELQGEWYKLTPVQ